MTYTPPTVNYSTTLTGTYTTLTGIQSVSINRGRQRFVDNFAQTSCVIELIPATSYAVPLAVGQFIDVRDANTSTSPCYFAGIITDVERTYEIPYNAGTGAAPADRIRISASGCIGVFGQNSLSNYVVAPDNATTAIFLVAIDTDLYAGVLAPGAAASSGFTFTGGTLDLINGLLRTCQYFISDIDNKRTATYSSSLTSAVHPGGWGNLEFVYSDAGTVGAVKYSQLDYQSSVQNYFTQVDVVPSDLATQTATSGSGPYNTLVYNTYNVSTAKALDLANFLISAQNAAQITPFSLTSSTLISSTCIDVAKLSTTDVFATGSAPINLGSAVTVEFRGTTAQAQIQGIHTMFYPDYAIVQLYLSPNLSAQFILDNDSFGVLDQNKLGF